MPKPNEPDIEHDIVVKMKPKAVRKLLLGAAIQTPTETTCWDGGEHKTRLIGLSFKLCNRCGVILRQALDRCDQTGPTSLVVETHYEIEFIPTMFDELSQRKDETDAD